MSEGLALLDTEGRVTYRNPAFCQITGYSSGELLGHPLAELFDLPDRPWLQARLADSRRGDAESCEIGLTRSDGERRILRATARPLDDGHGRCAGGFVLITDITVHRQAEDCLAQLSSTLERSPGGTAPNRPAPQEDSAERQQLQQRLMESSSQLLILSERLLSIQEQERQRIASDLHDGIGQYLHALKLTLQRTTPEHCRIEVEASRPPPCLNPTQIIQEAIEEVRRIAADLRPALLDDLGILATIGWYCRRFQSVYSGIRIDKHLNIQEGDVPESLKITLFRVLQEALTNAAKHAHATVIGISLANTADGIELRIEDDGVGFDLARVRDRDPAQRGFGLISMAERVKLSGGCFGIEAYPGQGAQVRARWPVGQGLESPDSHAR